MRLKTSTYIIIGVLGFLALLMFLMPLLLFK